ncbi:hemerythrin domain-containing protein [Aliiroseovarius sp. PTFE2010]|uniref:hemerythrin domain-containing protein n=1 Tax=Aliiroseovarius sp. PTFE2010 TaxID=3417190 RepID=UPI003CF52A97
MDDNTLALATREKLPEALRVLLADYPRAAWEAHPNFSGLVQFWLERHLMFRKLLGLLQTDAAQRLDRAIAPDQYSARLGRFGSMLVEQLHGHHQIEDHHYFPQLRVLDPRLERAFDVLDRDHHAMDGLLNRFTEAANGVLLQPDEEQARESTARFDKELGSFQRMLDRHLCDEEEIIAPVILKHGPGGLM